VGFRSVPRPPLNFIRWHGSDPSVQQRHPVAGVSRPAPPNPRPVRSPAGTYAKPRGRDGIARLCEAGVKDHTIARPHRRIVAVDEAARGSPAHRLEDRPTKRPRRCSDACGSSRRRRESLRGDVRSLRYDLRMAGPHHPRRDFMKLSGRASCPIGPTHGRERPGRRRASPFRPARRLRSAATGALAWRAVPHPPADTRASTSWQSRRSSRSPSRRQRPRTSRPSDRSTRHPCRSRRSMTTVWGPAWRSASTIRCARLGPPSSRMRRPTTRRSIWPPAPSSAALTASLSRWSSPSRRPGSIRRRRSPSAASRRPWTSSSRARRTPSSTGGARAASRQTPTER